MYTGWQALLEKIILGEPGSYQNFLATRRELQGGYSDLEFATFIVQQPDLSRLEAQVYIALESSILIKAAREHEFLCLKLVELLKAVIANSNVKEIQKFCASFLLLTLERWLKQSLTVSDFDKQVFEKFYSVASDTKVTSNALVKFCLAVLYEYGIGVKENEVEAVKWFQIASEQGFEEAQFRLGLMYADGRGVARNIEKATELYRCAAEKGYALAQCELGLMYDRGNDITQNDDLAFELYQFAADQGDADAQFNVGYMYEHGRSVGQDYELAFEWYQLAAKQGLAKAECVLGLTYLQGRGVKKDIAEAKMWILRAFLQGFEHASKALYFVLMAQTQADHQEQGEEQSNKQSAGGVVCYGSPIHSTARNQSPQPDKPDKEEELDSACKLGLM